jgi:hypothetical protein
MPRYFRSISRIALAFGALAVLSTGCDRFGRDPQQSESGGEIDDSFEPAKVKSVKGVPAAEVRTAIDKRLDGARPKPIRRSQ